jgi:hypothetical protein
MTRFGVYDAMDDRRQCWQYCFSSRLVQEEKIFLVLDSKGTSGSLDP